VKQLLQNVKNGQLDLAEVPVPRAEGNRLLVRTHASLISAGTERMVAELARKGLLGKARARPDLVKKVLAKLRRDGLLATLASVQDQLDRWMPLGYSAAGEVVAVGPAVGRFRPGQRVACAGAGVANHAEYNAVPELLAAAVPDGVSDEAAAYATLGAIALQGIRNADVRVGEYVVVVGLGLLGQLAVEILRAAGCRVAGLDPVASRRELAAAAGAELVLSPQASAVPAVRSWSRGLGADAVLITAATASNAPVELAAELARDRARVVMVGVTGMNIPRKAYYEKELTFIVSRSYGPGRYDRQYEEHGHDYPPGYVRWTEGRNLQAFLDLVASGRVRPERLTTHRFSIERAAEAFELILRGREPYLGVVLEYPRRASPPQPRIALSALPRRPLAKSTLGVSFIGAGSFARSVLLPILKKRSDVTFRGIVTASGTTAATVGPKYGFAWCSSDPAEVFSDPETDAVFIVTRHSQHAPLVCQALEAGKAVFCEKPLAISAEQLEAVRQVLARCAAVGPPINAASLPSDAGFSPPDAAANGATQHAAAAGNHCPPRLMVGFNRRFAPLAGELKAFLAGRGPMSVTYRVNAGPVPPDHWLADPAEGGRIAGEACHFLDFFAFLTGDRPEDLRRLSPDGARPADDAQLLVRYSDGSLCHLMYTTSGPAGASKERIEAYAGGAMAVLEDFRRLELIEPTGRRRVRRLWRADKGHAAEIAAFVALARGSTPAPVAPESLLETTALTIA